MGGGGLGELIPWWLNLCFGEKNLCQLAHSPAPWLHSEPNTAGGHGRHQTCLTDLTKMLTPGPRKPWESTPCSQVSGVACKHPPKAWPRENLPSVPFLGRPYWAQDLVQVLPLRGLAWPRRTGMITCHVLLIQVLLGTECRQCQMPPRGHYHQTKLLWINPGGVVFWSHFSNHFQVRRISNLTSGRRRKHGWSLSFPQTPGQRRSRWQGAGRNVLEGTVFCFLTAIHWTLLDDFCQLVASREVQAGSNWGNTKGVEMKDTWPRLEGGMRKCIGKESWNALPYCMYRAEWKHPSVLQIDGGLRRARKLVSLCREHAEAPLNYTYVINDITHQLTPAKSHLGTRCGNTNNKGFLWTSEKPGCVSDTTDRGCGSFWGFGMKLPCSSLLWLLVSQPGLVLSEV